VARALAGLALFVCLVCAALLALSHFWLFPWLGENRQWVADELSRTAGVTVSIEKLEADWFGMRPRLRLGGLTMQAGERDALRLERVEATLAWVSLPRWALYFHHLEIAGPEIELGRARDGVFTVAGIRMEPGGTQAGGNPVAWLLGQSRIAVRDATLIWNDALRGAPPLRLNELRFSLERGMFQHHFELEARPPAELADQIKASGEVSRYEPDAPERTIGRLYVGLDRAELGGWQAWVDYPVPATGRGSVHLWLGSNGQGAFDASADIDLENVDTTLADGLTPLRFDRLGGRLFARRSPDKDEFGARSLWLVGKEGRIDPFDFSFALERDHDGNPDGGAFSASLLDLEILARLAGSLPLDERLRAQLAGFDPKGRLLDVSLAWQGDPAAPRDWTIKTQLEGLGLTAQGLIPGMGNISGWIDGGRHSGRYALSGRDAFVDLPKVFETSHIALTDAEAVGGWSDESGQMEIRFDSIRFANDDTTGTASGHYRLVENDLGEIDITGQLGRTDGAAVWRYLPFVTGHARQWVKSSIRHAEAKDVNLVLKGPLRHFPFRAGEGTFLVSFQTENTLLDYADGWPALDKLAGNVRFEGPGLTITSEGGNVFGVRVEPVQVRIPDLTEAIMSIEGVAKGPSADFLRFIDESPLAARLRGFTGALRAEGKGQLDLKLRIPLLDLAGVKVDGEYRFAANRVRLDDLAPALDAAEGKLGFSEEALQGLSIRGRLLGGHCAIEGKTNANGLTLAARGQLDVAAAREELDLPLLAWLSGSAPWQADIVLGHNDNGRITLQSGLKGIRSRLPAPFSKEADDPWPLEVVAASPGANKTRQLTVKLGGLLDVALEREPSGLTHGGVGLNRPAPASSTGVKLAAAFDVLDIDAWQWSLDDGKNGDGAALPLESIALEAGRMRAFGYLFNAVKLLSASDPEGWKTRLESTEAQGEILWRRANEGMLLARLSRLAFLPGNEDHGSIGSTDGNNGMTPPRSLPGLDVQAESFAVGTRELGRLEVRAANREGVWWLTDLSIRHPHAQFSGSGRWRPGERHSQLDFMLDSDNAGYFARDMGYPNVLRGGQVKLSGSLEWAGVPSRIDYPTLSGKLELNAGKGRFEKLEPGFGRLLGILSLQALPRRVTLDFRDVFSDGFVFDRINGKVAVSGGVMRTEGIDIVGPAARVKMSGQANIAAETQDLRVNVRPTLAESVAVGAAIVNPLAGAVTYVAQKVLGDPIEKLFAYDYKVTGSWADPVVEKVGSSPAPREETEQDAFNIRQREAAHNGTP
jgi:uncharacterized protein (TIGR02099 family)